SARFVFFFQAEDGIRDDLVTGVQTCALPIFVRSTARHRSKDMSHLPLPYRGDVPNDEYIAYWRKHWKDATTPLMSTRGCPFRCRSEERRVGKECRERAAADL